MFKMSIRLGWFLGIATCSAIALSPNSASAQITPDSTLPNNSIVTPDGSTLNITGGTQAGGNLFHSFGEFSVPNGSTAFFNNAADIQNIISRVTGRSVSNIDGIIRANGTANLFLINPNGIVFGANARLNVGGSFVASTASSLKFADDIEFTATVPQTAPLLTVSVPIGLQFRGNPGSVQNQSVARDSNGETIGLQVQLGKTLVLVGGNVVFDGGSVQAANGRVELAALAGQGAVGLLVNGNNMSLSVPQDVARADVSLNNAAKVDVTDKGQGNIRITADNISILGGSRINAGIGKGLTAESSRPGDITLNATGSVTINQVSQLANVVASDASGNAGDINIKAENISVIDMAKYPALDSSNQGQGSGGNVLLEANDSISLIGQNQPENDKTISSRSTDYGLDAGNISFKANGSIYIENAYFDAISRSSRGGNAGNILLLGNESVSIVNNTALVASTYYEKGNAGNIIVQSSGSVYLQTSMLAANVGTDSNSPATQSKAGNIRILGRSVSITDGAVVTSRAFIGNSSNIEINAQEFVELSGIGPFPRPEGYRPQNLIYSQLTTSGEERASSPSGDISITTGTLRLSDGANIRADSGSTFRGGNITVNAKVVELTGGGQLSTTASSSGDAGKITFNVTDRITINGSNPRYDEFNEVTKIYEPETEFIRGPINRASGIFANTSGGFTSQGGDLKITAGRLLVSDGGRVSAESEAAGTAGSLTIKTGQLQLKDRAGITVSAPYGQAGNLEITAKSILLENLGQLIAVTAVGEKGGNISLQDFDLLVMRQNSLISASAINNANGGNITINAPNGFIVSGARENSDITANAYTGIGGRVDIKAFGIFGIQPRPRQTEMSDITASSELGVNGVVTVNTPDIDPNRGLVNLPTVPLDTEVSQVCQPRSAENQSSFVITGRGGLPPNPRTDLLSGDAVQVDWVTLNPNSNNRTPTVIKNPTATPPQPIIEATGWVRNENGEVVLTANPSTVTPHSPWITPASCNTKT